MAKRLTPEEREARIKAYEEAKAARQAARAEKQEARIEAQKKAKEERNKRKVNKVPLLPESTKVGQVKRFPTYKGEVKIGDEVGFRWLGIAMGGTLVRIEKSRNYRVREGEEKEAGYTLHYVILESSGKDFYPVKREDILAKKINGEWVDNCN